VPIYPTFFIIGHPDDIMPSLPRTVAGFALIAGAVMMIVSQSPKVIHPIARTRSSSRSRLHCRTSCPTSC
jgi:hypothetical protein